MSRIRSVHPGFFTDEDLVSVSMAARLLFIGIGVEADDKGIFVWKPLTIKMRVFPADNVDVASLLCELVEAGVIKHYAVDGKSYGAIKNFRKYQRPKTPNDIHPATEDIISFVGLDQPNSEKKQVKETPFPPEGEKSSQMEDEGGRKEEDDKTDVLPSSTPAADDEPRKRKSRKSPPFVEETFVLPSDIPAEPWAAFVSMRSGIGKRIKTEDGANGIIRELRKFAEDGHPPGEVLMQSVAFEYQGVFPLKTGRTSNGTGNSNNGFGGAEPVSYSPLVQAIAASRAQRASGEPELFEPDAGCWP